MIKLFSHTDLDGYGCNVVMKYYYENNVQCENLDYGNVNDVIMEYINKELYKDYEITYITDISVNSEVAQRINELVVNGYEFKLFDHHKNLEHLKMYDWCNIVDGESDGIKWCGTKILYEYLKDLHKNDDLNRFVELVNYYDTWLWKDNNVLSAKDLNDLFFILGSDRFIELLSECDYDADMVLGNNRILLDIENDKRNKYINKKLEQTQIKRSKINNLIYGITLADSYISELGNTMCERLDIDFAVIVCNDKISLRSIGDVDVSLIAKEFGGGGHKNASGFEFEVLDIINMF